MKLCSLGAMASSETMDPVLHSFYTHVQDALSYYYALKCKIIKGYIHIFFIDAYMQIAKCYCDSAFCRFY